MVHLITLLFNGTLQIISLNKFKNKNK